MKSLAWLKKALLELARRAAQFLVAEIPINTSSYSDDALRLYLRIKDVLRRRFAFLLLMQD